jgi:hypothetical protein
LFACQSASSGTLRCRERKERDNPCHRRSIRLVFTNTTVSLAEALATWDVQHARVTPNILCLKSAWPCSSQHLLNRLLCIHAQDWYVSSTDASCVRSTRMLISSQEPIHQRHCPLPLLLLLLRKRPRRAWLFMLN